jgi:hypothetical protein
LGAVVDDCSRSNRTPGAGSLMRSVLAPWLLFSSPDPTPVRVNTPPKVALGNTSADRFHRRRRSRSRSHRCSILPAHQ